MNPVILEIEVFGDVIDDLDREPLTRLVQAINQLQPDWLRESGTINLKLVDDASIRDLNKQYSGNDYATDVLSFSYIEGGQSPIDGALGDMVISLETASRQAAQAGTALGEEVATLVLHGILHIFEFDHQSDTQADLMDQIQGDILKHAEITYRDFGWKSTAHNNVEA